MAGEAPLATVAVWDVPVRVVHWSFVGLLPGLWWTAQTGRLDLHFTLGVVMLGLIAFRLLWGLVGSSTARFSQFVAGPAAILRYLRVPVQDNARKPLGHNPLGALSVLGLLSLLALQVTVGLFAQDTDAVSSGPLNHLVSWDTATQASSVHGFVFNLLLGIVALHVSAIVFYRIVRKDDLVTPMITGRKKVASLNPVPTIASAWKAAFVATAAAVFALWVSYGVPPWGAKFPWDQPDVTENVLSVDSYM